MRPYHPYILILQVLLLVAGLCGCAGKPETQFIPPATVETADPIADLLPPLAPTPSPPPSRQEPTTPAPAEIHPAQALEKMGFSTQVGAFSNLDNAVRLEQALEAKGIDAYYFRHESGLYKVRFGNHKSYRAARAEAEALQSQGLIDRFFIVIPDDYAAARIDRAGKGDLRDELVKTARRFLGVPYRWGGEDRKNGFDCSGLTMVCYRLNGLNLPRNSRMQYRAGRRIDKRQLRKGDLVFFATHGGKRVTHVGLYAGKGKFIHAPRTGKTVRYASLSNRYWRKAYVGARRYF